MSISLSRRRMDTVDVSAMEKLAPAYRPLRAEAGTPDIHGNRRLGRYGLGVTNRWGLTPGQLSKAKWGWTRWRWLPHPPPATPYSVSHQLRILKPAGAGIGSSFRTWRRSGNLFMDVLSKPTVPRVYMSRTKEPRYGDMHLVPGWARNLEGEVQILKDTLGNVINRLSRDTREGAGESSTGLHTLSTAARRVPTPAAHTTMGPGTRPSPSTTASSQRPVTKTTRTTPSDKHEPTTAPDRSRSAPPSWEGEDDGAMPKAEQALQEVLQGMREELTSIKKAYSDLHNKIEKCHRPAASGDSMKCPGKCPTNEKPLGEATTAEPGTGKTPPPESATVKELKAEKARCERQAKRQQNVIDILFQQITSLNRNISPDRAGSRIETTPRPSNTSDDTGAPTVVLPTPQTASPTNAGLDGTKRSAYQNRAEEKLRTPLPGLATTPITTSSRTTTGTSRVPTDEPDITRALALLSRTLTTSGTDASVVGTVPPDQGVEEALAVIEEALFAASASAPADESTAQDPDDTTGTVVTAQDPSITRALAVIKQSLLAAGTGASSENTIPIITDPDSSHDTVGTTTATATTTSEDLKTPPPATERVIVSAKEQVHAAFCALRTKTRNFSYSAAFQLGSPMSFVSDMQKKAQEQPFCKPQVWDRLNRDQRANRVCQLIFLWLWRQILRPGVESFGVKVAYDPTDPPRGLTPLQVASQEESWTPLQKLARAIAPLGEKIFRNLSPVIHFEFARNEHLVRRQIWGICHDAALLKMMFREVAGKQMKIEVPGAHGDKLTENKWMEQGFDELTGALPLREWVRIIDLERSSRKTAFVSVPFGALTMVVDGKKVVLERAWVVGNEDEEYISSGLFVRPRKSSDQAEGPGPGSDREDADETESAGEKENRGERENRGKTETTDETENGDKIENTNETEDTGTDKTAKPGETKTASEDGKPVAQKQTKEASHPVIPVIIISSDSGDSESESESDDIKKDPTWRPSSKPVEVSTATATSGPVLPKKPTAQSEQSSSTAVGPDTITDVLRTVTPSNSQTTFVPHMTSTSIVPGPRTSSVALAHQADADGQRKKKKRRRRRRESDPDWIPGQTDGESESSTEGNEPKAERANKKLRETPDDDGL
ncbi:hypothetical protein QBC41DRAFT_283485 [Cercophora samala]|uniref:Uncharacterized protein n=1 Tax=Cercophora samala TaxID=330535 RepID=A0AA39Z6P5_9PEZI|nr:hypothetical protein QBC41DRAFT_283485 [Cercophora samala]